MADFQALQEQVAVLQGQINAQAAFGLNPFTNQTSHRFRQMVERIDQVTFASSSGKNTLMSFTLEPLTFMGRGRMCAVYIAGGVGNGSITNRTVTFGITINGTEYFSDSTPLDAGTSGSFEWETKIVGYPSLPTNLIMFSNYARGTDIFDSITHHGVYGATLSTFDLNQPTIVSFTAQLSASDANLSISVLAGIAELV